VFGFTLKILDPHFYMKISYLNKFSLDKDHKSTSNLILNHYNDSAQQGIKSTTLEYTFDDQVNQGARRTNT